MDLWVSESAWLKFLRPTVDTIRCKNFMIRRINHFNLWNQPISISCAKKANILLFQFLKYENCCFSWFYYQLSLQVWGLLISWLIWSHATKVSLVIVKKNATSTVSWDSFITFGSRRIRYLSTPPQFHNFELAHLNGDCLTYLAFSEHLFGVSMKITNTISKKLSVWMHFVQTDGQKAVYVSQLNNQHGRRSKNCS